MKIRSINIKNQDLERHIEFDEKINLIYSKDNSKGKTTLLRVLLFGLGYNIPATDGMKTFDNLDIELELSNNDKEFKLVRHGDIIELQFQDEKLNYLLPEQITELHSFIFEIDDEIILNNLLATFYIDQEKGWTLLNRGIIIGKNRFNVDDFISALSDKEVSDINNEIKSIADELRKYKSLKSIAQYKEETLIEGTTSYSKKDDDELYRRERYLIEKKEELLADIQDISKIIKDNKKLIEYLERLEICVEINETESIRVNKDNILNFSENQMFYETRKKDLEIQLGKIKSEISKIETELGQRNMLFNMKTVADEIDGMLQDVNIDETQIEKIINQYTRRKTKLVNDLRNVLSNNNKYVTSIYETVKKYAKELGIEQYVKDDCKFVLTHQLKGKTGRVLIQMCFIFKIAYVLEIKKKFGLILPLIIDSPRTGELTDKSSTDMMKILQRDFKEHQIIFASVYKFDDIKKNTIELKNNLFD